MSSRHLAYVGEPVTLQALLLDPARSLAAQSVSPHLQLHGVVNADGFGVGWYALGREEPVRYRRAQPIWTDASFASLAPTISSSCILGAVRSETTAFAHDESVVAPFAQGRWLFSHDGKVADGHSARRTLYASTLDIPEAMAPGDSALVFGLAASRWTAGTPLGAALVEVIREVQTVGGGRLNLLAVDGHGFAGTTYGEQLWVLEKDTGITAASDPYDDDPDWLEVPQGVLVEGNEHGLTLTPLEL
ncbi:MAG: gamma-glutamyl hercynylcysteine S-oxide hydrolase [Nocardioidaceae bacterium]|jgi:glutamine amidotransferase|nr:gamma-glutamyl hercynylcysteine S-oxide hydrolase [Nocardioidaceae bacterium]